MNWLTTLVLHSTAIIRQCKKAIHTILGVPNYEAYVKHLGTVHPEKSPLDKETFYRKAMDLKAEDGKIHRCC